MNTYQGKSRYDSEAYLRRGSRYTTEGYLRRGSRYEMSGTVVHGGNGQNAAQHAGIAIDWPDIPAAWEALRSKAAGIQLPHAQRRSVVMFAALAAAAAVYSGGILYFSEHYYPGTQVMGMDCSGMTADQVRAQITDAVSWYRLAVTERNGDQDLIYASQIDLQYHDDQSLESALKQQQSYLWPVCLLRGDSAQVQVSTEYSRELLEQVFAELPCLDAETMIAPEDAYIAIEDNLLVVVPEVMGTTVDAASVTAAITEALNEGYAAIDLEEAGCYLSPAVYSDDEALNRQVTSKNKALGVNITMDFGEQTETIDTQVLLDMLSLDGDGAYYVSEETVWNYTAQLAQKYDTYNSERTFVSSIGTVETLQGIGDYGWLLDQDETAQLILEAIRSKQTGSIEPVYLHTACSRMADDIGDTYVEVCIAQQTMWMYKDGELLVETPVVTGNHAKNYDTPSGGVWAIDGKYTDFTLVGDTYRQPVNYWLPFNGGVGIHDLTSRAYYGGSIYLTNGSHGCVNTPLAAVELIYENVEVGTPVIVYEGV